MSRAALRSTIRMAIVMRMPTRGSASGNPARSPSAPATTASDVKPSVRACSPSATSAADAVERDELVADEPDQSGGDEHADSGDRFGMDEAADRLGSGDNSRECDHG